MINELSQKLTKENENTTKSELDLNAVYTVRYVKPRNRSEAKI